MNFNHKSFGRLILPALLIVAAVGTSDAHAQGGVVVRAGASLDPDQFYLGGHAEMGPLIERLWFRPNLEVGVGDNRTLVAFNGEFTYWFPLEQNEWSAYVGAGPALNIINFDNPAGDSETDAEGGFNILLGLAHSGGLFTELKVGALDSPDLKFGVGYTFR
jgi:hypothetical protein